MSDSECKWPKYILLGRFYHLSRFICIMIHNTSHLSCLCVHCVLSVSAPHPPTQLYPTDHIVLQSGNCTMLLITIGLHFQSAMFSNIVSNIQKFSLALPYKQVWAISHMQEINILSLCMFHWVYLHCIQDMLFVIVHSYGDIWNILFGHFTNCLCICEVLTLCSLCV